MLSEVQIVRAAIGEALIPIIAIIVWIVSSIVKAGKQGQPARGEQQTPGPSRSPAEDPQDELRKFLEQLSGGAAPPQAEAPPPPAAEPSPPPIYEPPPNEVPPPVRERSHVREAPRVQQPPAVQPRRPATQEPAHPDRSCSVDEARERIIQSREFIASKTHAAPRQKQQMSSALRRLIGDLTRPETARKAIILREILGPPLGLQDRRL